MKLRGSSVSRPAVHQNQATVFSLGGQNLEAVAPIYTGDTLRGYVMGLRLDRNWGYQRLDDILHSTVDLQHYLAGRVRCSGSFNGALHYAAIGRSPWAPPH